MSASKGNSYFTKILVTQMVVKSKQVQTR